MKKLFTSFISLMTIGTFSQCGFKSNDKSQSSSSASDKQATDKKEKQVTTKTQSSSSSSIRSSTRNQYLRKSHEEWIANSLSEMKSKLKDNTKYKTAFDIWKDTGDGNKAKTNAYSKSDGFEQAFTNWKANSRTKEEFANKIVNKNTASYQIYKTWIGSVKGQSEMKTLYTTRLPIYNTNYQRWSNALAGKSEGDYALVKESDAAFNAWRASGGGINALKQLFVNSAAYRTKYNEWMGTTDAQKNKYIESGSSNSTDIYNAWRQSLSGRTALKSLWYSTTDGDHNFKNVVSNWNGQGNANSGNTNNNFGTKQGYLNDQIPAYGTAPKPDAIAWINTDAAINVFKAQYNNLFAGALIAYTNDIYKEKLKQASPIDLNRGGINQSRIVLQAAFFNALNNPGTHPQLATSYNNWKAKQYKLPDNSVKHNSKLDQWTSDKKTTTTPDVKNAFRTALGENPSNEKNAFDTWKTNNLAEANYQASSTYGTDITAWAEDKKTQTSPQDVKAAFIQAMRSGAPKTAYDNWKTPTPENYKKSSTYISDFTSYLDLDTTRGADTIKDKIKEIIDGPNVNDDGNKKLMDDFNAWKLKSRENFVKSEARNSQFNTWSPSESDLAILNEIAQILQDKDLFTSSDGNSQLIKVLKEITQDSYNSYILTL